MRWLGAPTVTGMTTSKANALRTITCVGCGDEHTGRVPPGRKYCSRECWMTLRKTRKGSTLACEHCHAEFYVPHGRADKARFCSARCQSEWQGRNKTRHTCGTCSEEFRWSPSRTRAGYDPRWCSVACRTAAPEWRAAVVESNTLQQLGRETRPESIGYALLSAFGVEFERQAIFAKKFTPDALVRGCLLAVQFDGDYWHDRSGTNQEPRIRKRVALDASQDAYLAACGWSVVRLWETDLIADPEGCSEVLAAAIIEGRIRHEEGPVRLRVPCAR